MIGIVITGHGSFPNGMFESVKLIAGEVKQVEVIPFEEDQDKLQEALTQSIKNVDTGDGVVCFTDLAGGTPFNVCSRLAISIKNVRVIGGMNSPMLLSGLFQRELSINEFVEEVLLEGKENIKQFEIKETQVSKEMDGI
ncbi:PTS sugar transporter subunit IIA [Halobacillus shinanisalinarum]|uniref:PTS sugar transporter subunit IIA n=1 Tax=Halobacillus shinanisalinarum TaxID=2932258 RepID=A0ABY4GVE9_9BACI|nr:PTS sugar transporter subunit IIA [Halobacillus shinanisalinarum]UOQ91951.1 PTS sugar transporter subunit IIA [Halobacillus shinanisalinarum]